MRLTPAAAIFGDEFRIEIGKLGRAPTDQAGLIKEIRIGCDQPLGEWLRLREEIPVPVRAGDMAVGLHEHRIGRRNVEDGERNDDIGMIERHPVRGAPAAVMADDVKAIEAERFHQSDLIAGHGAERIVRPVGRACRLG